MKTLYSYCEQVGRRGKDYEKELFLITSTPKYLNE
jgi:hypothetical protein